jgi:predicted nucleotidyltransferase
VSRVVYSLEEIKERVVPIAQKYDIPIVYIFGSYARGEATENSDVDVLFQSEGSKIRGFVLGAFYEDLRESLGKGLDLVDVGALEQPETQIETPWFLENVYRERVKIYG